MADLGWISKLIDLRGSKAFVLFVASAGVSVGYREKLGELGNLPETWILVANIAALVFGAMTLLWIVELLFGPVIRAWRRRKNEMQIRGLLSSLGDEERLLLTRMREANQQSVSRPITDAVASRLKQKGLLLPGAGVGHMMEWPFTIPSDVWKVVQRNDW